MTPATILHKELDMRMKEYYFLYMEASNITWEIWAIIGVGLLAGIKMIVKMSKVIYTRITHKKEK